MQHHSAIAAEERRLGVVLCEDLYVQQEECTRGTILFPHSLSSDGFMNFPPSPAASLVSTLPENRRPQSPNDDQT